MCIRDRQFTSDDLSLNVSGMGEGSHQVQPTLNRELDSAYDLLGISSCTVTAVSYTHLAHELPDAAPE